MTKIRALAVMREMFIRRIMIEWLDRDAKQLPEMWQKGVFLPVRDRLKKEGVELKRALETNGVFLIEQHWSDLEVFVKYKENGRILEVRYFIETLTAEAEGRIESFPN